MPFKTASEVLGFAIEPKALLYHQMGAQAMMVVWKTSTAMLRNYSRWTSSAAFHHLHHNVPSSERFVFLFSTS